MLPPPAPSPIPNLSKKQLSFYLEDMETVVGRAFNLGVTLLVLLSSGIFVAQTYGLSDDVRLVLDRIDTGILAIFAGEYLLRLWLAERKLRYIFSLYSLIDLLVLLPFFTGLVNISFLRVLRSFRILRLVRFVEGRTVFGYVTGEDSVIFSRILLTLFIIVFVFSALIYQVEHFADPQDFGTFLDAVYFAVATMTTVGFGDVTPNSQLGRFLTVLMILTGITLIPWQIGDLVKRLAQAADQRQVTCTNCGLTTHAADANFCRNCGTRLPYPTCPVDGMPP
jgi:voltage-gated potassium channel